jgi:PEP-CTERM motif
MSVARDSIRQGPEEGTLSTPPRERSTLRQLASRLYLVLSIFGCTFGVANAGGIVVGHDINTLGSFVAGSQESAFAVNVASYLTSGSATKSLLLFESNPGDGTRNFAPGVLAALTGAGFSLTVTSNYATSFSGFDALFVAQDFPTIGFLDNTALINYVSGGGGVYLAGGVGPSAASEAAGWSAFLGHYGLAFASGGYNGINSVAITSNHPIFSGITRLGSGNGQSIINLGTDPDAQIVQFSGTQGVYAVVSVGSVPEPGTVALLSVGLLAVVGARTRTILRREGVAGTRPLSN